MYINFKIYKILTANFHIFKVYTAGQVLLALIILLSPFRHVIKVYVLTQVDNCILQIGTIFT